LDAVNSGVSPFRADEQARWMPADHRRRLDIPACAGLPLEDFPADDLPKAGALFVGFADLRQFD